MEAMRPALVWPLAPSTKYNGTMQEDDAEELVVAVLWDLAGMALEEGLELHRSYSEKTEELPFTLVLSALDVALALVVRHPEWTGRLAALRLGLGEGELSDANTLDRFVELRPLNG